MPSFQRVHAPGPPPPMTPCAHMQLLATTPPELLTPRQRHEAGLLRIKPFRKRDGAIFRRRADFNSIPPAAAIADMRFPVAGAVFWPYGYGTQPQAQFGFPGWYEDEHQGTEREREPGEVVPWMYPFPPPPMSVMQLGPEACDQYIRENLSAMGLGRGQGQGQGQGQWRAWEVRERDGGGGEREKEREKKKDKGKERGDDHHHHHTRKHARAHHESSDRTPIIHEASPSHCSAEQRGSATIEDRLRAAFRDLRAAPSHDAGGGEDARRRGARSGSWERTRERDVGWRGHEREREREHVDMMTVTEDAFVELLHGVLANMIGMRVRVDERG